MNAPLVLVAIAALLFCAAPLDAAAPPTLDQTAPPKEAPGFVPPKVQPRSTGEDIATAIPIPGLPFTDSGNTCDYAHDYEEDCPFGASLSPDVVYSYAPTEDTPVHISLCASLYDTKLYVYENDETNLHACNDDFCGPDGYRSELLLVWMTAGNTYYIVVDGYSSACGEYVLEMAVQDPVFLECPAGARLEGEPECHDDYVDDYNGGCGELPPEFTWLQGTVGGEHFDVCGTAGTFLRDGQPARDTDWYELLLTETNTIEFECQAEFPVVIILLDTTLGCENPLTLVYDVAQSFPDRAEISYDCGPGTYWFHVAPSVYNQVPCGARYVVGVDGYTVVTLSAPAGIGPSSWGSIKGLHR